MASLDDAQLILIDNWPGTPLDKVAYPDITGLTEWHDTEVWPAGSKIQLYDSGNKGWSTFIFLKYMKGADHDINLAAKNVVGIWDTSPLWYEVLNDGGEMLVQGPLAIALAAIDYGVVFTTGGKTYKWGWFWCGGVCPATIVTDLNGDFTTSAATQGAGLIAEDNAGAAATLVNGGNATTGVMSAIALSTAA